MKTEGEGRDPRLAGDSCRGYLVARRGDHVACRRYLVAWHIYSVACRRSLVACHRYPAATKSGTNVRHDRNGRFDAQT